MARRQYDPYAPRKRPWELSLVVVLCWVQAIVDVVGGVLIILDRFPDEFATTSGVTIETLAAAGTVLIGLFLVGVASGIAHGDRVARIALTVLLVLDIASDVYLNPVEPSQTLVRLGSGILAVIMLVIVWTGRSRHYFAYRP